MESGYDNRQDWTKWDGSGAPRSAAMFVGAAAVGMAAMYMLDPDKGKRRRALVGDKAYALASDTRHAARRRHARCRASNRRTAGPCAAPADRHADPGRPAVDRARTRAHGPPRVASACDPGRRQQRARDAQRSHPRARSRAPARCHSHGLGRVRRGRSARRARLARIHFEPAGRRAPIGRVRAHALDAGTAHGGTPRRSRSVRVRRARPLAHRPRPRRQRPCLDGARRNERAAGATRRHRGDR